MPIIRKSIGQLIAENAKAYCDRDALIHSETGHRYTYRELINEVDRAAGGFFSRGVRPGDKIALWSSNHPRWMVAFLGLAKMGAVAVPIDPAATEENVGYILKQSESRGIVFADTSASGEMSAVVSRAKGDFPLLEHAISLCGSSDTDPDPKPVTWKELIAGGEDIDPQGFVEVTDCVDPEDPVAIMYTSGTTGQPKGVILDHLGLINKSLVSTERQGISADDRLCLFFPLFHMFGNTCIALAGLLRGAALIMPCRSFDPPRILAAISGERCTAIYGSPSMLITLVDHPQFVKQHWATLSKGIIGGAPCPMGLMQRIVEEIGVADITVAYGITETSSWITMTHPDDTLERRVSTIGTALACNEVKIVDTKSGRTLGPDRQGELCTRGLLMKGYYKMPAATAAAIDRDHWFHSGDLGVMDENGYVRITGRLKDVIVRNGAEIYPVEIEEVIYLLSEVSEVQVFGFPDQDKGQEIAAWIKLKEDSDLALNSVAAHVEARLPVEKHPRHYTIVTEFPMTGSGKVQKFKMAEIATQTYKR